MTTFSENNILRAGDGTFKQHLHAEPALGLPADPVRPDVTKVGTRVVWTHPSTGDHACGTSAGMDENEMLTMVKLDSGKSVEVFPDELTSEYEMLSQHVPVKPVETQRRIRGHNFYAPAATRKKIPALNQTEGTPADDKTVHLHYFTGGADWYVTELDPITNEAFGYGDPSGRGGEWGYIDLAELERVNLGGYRVVERDCHFTPDTFGNIAANRH